jgi:hypothetical protein
MGIRLCMRKRLDGQGVEEIVEAPQRPSGPVAAV